MNPEPTTNMLTQKLTIEQQQEILNSLFGFNFESDDEYKAKPHWVLYDDDGREFYGSDKNDEFDFSTFEGVIKYATSLAKEQGRNDIRYQLRNLIGV